MSEDWLNRWANGRTGWHEAEGNAGLKAHWPLVESSAAGCRRVLVPLCGKSPDLLWLVARGHEVVGVELAEIPILQLFEENNLGFEVEKGEHLDRYTAIDVALTLYRGDYFKFADALSSVPFDALFDRGALVALPEQLRPAYIEHTRRLLSPDAVKLIITLEYDQTVVQGPPFAVKPEEVLGGWGDMHRVAEADDIDHCPPKFRAAGLEEIHEVIWSSVPSTG